MFAYLFYMIFYIFLPCDIVNLFIVKFFVFFFAFKFSNIFNCILPALFKTQSLCGRQIETRIWMQRYHLS